AIASADRVLLMRRFRPIDATRAARRCCGARPAGPGIQLPARSLGGDPDLLLGHGHALRVDAADPERPVFAGRSVDLRRAGYELDQPLARGAALGAAWACRLAAGGCDLAELGHRYRALLRERGPAALDPFHDGFHAVAPWPLVAAVLERIPGIALTCPERGRAAAPAGRRPSAPGSSAHRRP
ncbi:MAG: hypothetical protein J0M02_02915, partial [Planctomycetes bacterium]|nr:hypothetical protein [Planctomycetota bacterium]